MQQLKTCKRCGQGKPLEDFGEDKSRADGLTYRCRKCTREAKLDLTQRKHLDALRAPIPPGFKRCAVCKKNCPKETFRKDRKLKDGLCSYCRPCSREKNRLWKLKNLDKAHGAVRRWKAANSEQCKAKNQEWVKANPHKLRSARASRKASKSRRTPEWLTPADFERMALIYDLAKGMEYATGIPHHVDHIIPLRGKLVSGLHCPSNLQIITAAENCSKSNRWNPDQ